MKAVTDFSLVEQPWRRNEVVHEVLYAWGFSLRGRPKYVSLRQERVSGAQSLRGNVCILIRRPYVGPCILDENVGVLRILLPQDMCCLCMDGDMIQNAAVRHEIIYYYCLLGICVYISCVLYE